jgi:hypothetical protein
MSLSSKTTRSDHGIGLTVFEAQSYPLPVRKSPADFHGRWTKANDMEGTQGLFEGGHSSATDLPPRRSFSLTTQSTEDPDAGKE